MKPILSLFLVLIFCGFTPYLQPRFTAEEKSQEEEALMNQINAHRKQKGLPAISWSEKLAKVARLHASDLQQFPPTAPCNMHSWSPNGKWSPCCYTPDHKEANCMWSKPKELTGYPGQGFEISAMNTGENVNWLEQWQKSQPHHQVIINEGIWKGKTWKAIGLSIRKPYAVVWFGLEADEN